MFRFRIKKLAVFVTGLLIAGATAMLNRFCTALELPTSPATLARLAADGRA